MAEQTNQEELAIRYLLGGLSDKDETSLEERLLSDDELFEDFEIAEGELIDRYVQDELNPDERRRVQAMIRNSPRIAERVEIARIFANRVTSPAPLQDEPQSAEPAVKQKKKETPKTPWWNLFVPSSELAPSMRVVAVAPLALLLVTSVFVVIVWTRYRIESQRWAKAEQQLSDLQKEIDNQNAKRSGLETTLTQTQQQTAEQEKLIADLQQQLAEQGRQVSSTAFSFFLNPGLGTRGGGKAEATIPIPSGKTQLELQLNVESGDYRQYVAFLQDINFKPIGRRQRLTPVRKGSRKFIPFKVPVSLIPPGSYLVHVDGVVSRDATENFNDYQFRVTAR